MLGTSLLWRSTAGVHLVTKKLNPPSALVYFRWSWSCYFGLDLGLVSSGLGLGLKNLVLFTSLLWLLVGYRLWAANLDERSLH